ncbi:MAG: EF-P lysine aminoacylase GenX [Gammaproteobacteria bacterium]|nr:EF-P lysine aminoacylase GenX [Gammaproteobacteria bacterium]
MGKNWRPRADLATIRLRAELLDNIRSFMKEEGVLEVETPILSPASIPDPNIHSLQTSLSEKTSKRYLGTSPEFYMKRLLAAGSGPIFQISRVFRDDATSRLHQPEFSMLEWYMPGYDHHNLMQQLSTLLISIGLSKPVKLSYEAAFVSELGLNPHTADVSELRELASKKGLYEAPAERSVLLEFLFSHTVSKKLGNEQAVLLVEYPVCQAALARISSDEMPTAERFELFISGIEIANGFHELTDANEQRDRFVMENTRRESMNLAQVPVDDNFLAALESGIPACAGVAVGLDRLLMILANKNRIEDLMTFPVELA